MLMMVMMSLRGVVMMTMTVSMAVTVIAGRDGDDHNATGLLLESDRRRHDHLPGHTARTEHWLPMLLIVSRVYVHVLTLADTCRRVVLRV